MVAGQYPDGQLVETFTIVTTEPNELVATIHNRTPVIMDAKDYSRWLDAETPGGGELLKPYPADEMRAYPDSTGVNKPANDDAGLIEAFHRRRRRLERQGALMRTRHVGQVWRALAGDYESSAHVRCPPQVRPAVS